MIIIITTRIIAHSWRDALRVEVEERFVRGRASAPARRCFIREYSHEFEQMAKKKKIHTKK